MQFEEIASLVQDDMSHLCEMVQAQLDSDIDLIHHVGQHVYQQKGKQLRPIMALLSAKAFAYDGNEHINFAAVVEFYHTSSLLHDDVLDGSTLRRGQKTANTIWGEKASILMGDFIFSKAFEVMLQHPQIEIYRLIAKTANLMTKGEIKQLRNRQNANFSFEHYFDIIECKTAALFSASAKIGPMLTNAEAFEQKAMADFGYHFGTSFQIIDDILDYESTPEVLGKNIGDDLADGKLTLPLLYALEDGNDEHRDIIKTALSTGDTSYLDKVLDLIHSTEALCKSKIKAKESIDKAVTALLHIKPSCFRDGLEHMAFNTITRVN